MNIKTLYYNSLLEEIPPLYPVMDDIRAVMKTAGLEAAEANLTGKGKNMWDSVLSLAEKEDKLLLLLETIFKDAPNKKLIAEVIEAMKDGTAFIEIKIATAPIVPGTITAANFFLVYDNEDQALVKELRKHLVVMEKFSLKLVSFDMQKVPPGEDVEKYRMQQAANSDVFLLMLTSNFFGNPDNDCLPIVFNAVEAKKRIVPILLKPCLWSRLKILENIMPLPANRKFATEWDNRDEVFLEIATGLENLVDYIISQKQQSIGR